ncbi:MAG: histidine kinase, partial [Burkholderiales bacterium]|nr:histidine kinase [Burkholderiales bacterium]
MCWPLKVEDSVIGVLSINRDEGMQPFTEEDLEQGGIMINIVSLVIDNTRLHAERQEQMEALKAANARLASINEKLQHAQQQVLQADKMASIGQLA